MKRLPEEGASFEAVGIRPTTNQSSEQESLDRFLCILLIGRWIHGRTILLPERTICCWSRNDAVNHVILLKRLLLFFWAVWLTGVFLSNSTDAGKGLVLLGESWAFASGNGKLLQETTAGYGIPDAVNAILFAGVILWEGVASVLFWRAAWSFRGRSSARKAVYFAFTTSLLLWGAFLVADPAAPECCCHGAAPRSWLPGRGGQGSRRTRRSWRRPSWLSRRRSRRGPAGCWLPPRRARDPPGGHFSCAGRE